MDRAPIETSRLRPTWAERLRIRRLATLALVVAADWLFHDEPVGWTAGAYLVLLAAVVARTHRGRWPRLPRRVRSGIGLVLVALVGVLVIEPDALSLSLAAAGLVCLAMVGRAGWTSDPATWIRRWERLLRKAGPRLVGDFQRSGGIQATGRGLVRAGTVALLALRGWGVPTLLTSVFVGLFALANPIVAEGLSGGARWMPRLLAPDRLALWFVAGCFVWLLVRIPTSRIDGYAPLRLLPGEALEPYLVGGIVERSLVLFNVAFAVENLLDLTYLWGGAALPEGMTYASYAHRGAYPLVATALLSAAFVLLVFRPGGSSERDRLARSLVLVWLGQNVLLTASAAWRLHLYVQVYGLTRLRLAAILWMGLVAAGLAATALRIHHGKTNRWLVQVAVSLALAVLYGASIADTDGAIARFNVAHCRELGGPGTRLDLRYPAELGPEALPALERFRELAPGYPRHEALRNLTASLRQDLREDLADWRGWSVRRARLAGELRPG